MGELKMQRAKSKGQRAKLWLLFTLATLLLPLSALPTAAQDTPLTNKFPAELNTADSLGRTADRSVGTLTAGINSSVTSFTITGDPASYPASGISIVIDNEIILCTSRSSDTFSGCTRGAKGTSAASHSTGAAVKAAILSAQRDVLVADLLEIEKKMGYGSSLASSASTGFCLRKNGDGTTGWSACPSATSSALTKTDDTNITFTLTGTPAGALLAPVNIAAGWTGTLAPSRGGTGVNNAGTFTNPANTTVTGGGTIALSGFTFTVPGTGTGVLNTRLLTSGAGLTGGGDLSSDRNFAVGAGTGITVNADDVALDTSHVRNVDHSAVSITAGAGLTGGGSIETTRTVNVIAGAGITVNADDVALTTPGTLTVSTSNSSSGNHTHAITSSSAPGAAASLLASASDGSLQLTTLKLGPMSTGVVPGFFAKDLAANFSIFGVYPQSGTNVNMSMQVFPKGTGQANNRAQVTVFNTDGVADTANIEFLTIRATGTTFLFASGQAGTGTLRPITMSAGAASGTPINTNQIYLDIDGDVGMGTATPRKKLDILSTVQSQLRLSYTDNSVFTDFTVGSGGNLTVAPTGDFIFDPVGNDVLPNTGYDLNLGALTKKYLTLHAAELWVETLVAQNTIATIGGRVLVAPTNMLAADLTDVATTITVKYNNFLTAAGANCSVGTPCQTYMEANGSVEFFDVTSAAGGSAGAYTYTVVRNRDGSGANTWSAGDAMVSTTTGFIDLYSVQGVKSGAGPAIVGNVRNSTTYNDWSEHWAIGNLNGLYGYGATTYGVGLGKYAASEFHSTLDSTNGLRFFTGLSTVIGQWSAAGVITVGQVAASQSNVFISAGVVELRNNTTARIRLAADGGGYLANSSISWDTSGNLTVAGNASIAGWTVNSTNLAKDTGTGSTSAGMAPADFPFYAGATVANRATAPFRVTPAGAVTATNATITGSVTATSGAIGGWTIGATTLTGGNAVLSSAGKLTLGTSNDVVNLDAADATYRLAIGHATYASAPFRVTKAGAVTATNATITGAITASSGSITGPLTISGASGSLAFGLTPPTSATVGTGLWLDRTGLYGLASSVQQAIFDAATGKIIAGAGGVELSSTGLTLNTTTGDAMSHAVTWYNSGAAANIGRINIYRKTAGEAQTQGNFIVHSYEASRHAVVEVTAQNSADNSASIQVFKYGASHANAGLGKIDLISDTVTISGGVVIGSPTGGDKGAGTINAQAVYDDNVLLTDWVFEFHYRGVSEPRAVATGSKRLFDLTETRLVTETEHRLPWMPRAAEFERERHVGGMVTRLWQGQEQQQLYIFELEQRLSELEKRLSGRKPE